MKMAESIPKVQKTLWEKEKLLVTSNFSFSYSVFKRLLLQTCKLPGLVLERVNILKFCRKSFLNVRFPCFDNCLPINFDFFFFSKHEPNSSNFLLQNSSYCFAIVLKFVQTLVITLELGNIVIFSSTGRRPASLCHSPLSVMHLSMH